MVATAAGEGGVSPALPDAAMRSLISLSALFAVMMVTIDGTIAIIALPRIGSSLSASQEQIAWVLTSYLVAGAIATPLSGWLADRYGRTKVMAVSVLAFTIASLGCGISANLEMLVVFRFLQGAFGASLVPLSQVLLLDIYPPDQQGKAISLFGMGTLFGPVFGALALLFLEQFLPAAISTIVHPFNPAGAAKAGEFWQIVLGPLLLVVVLFARGGIDGLLRALSDRAHGQRKRGHG